MQKKFKLIVTFLVIIGIINSVVFILGISDGLIMGKSGLLFSDIKREVVKEYKTIAEDGVEFDIIESQSYGTQKKYYYRVLFQGNEIFSNDGTDEYNLVQVILLYKVNHQKVYMIDSNRKVLIHYDINEKKYIGAYLSDILEAPKKYKVFKEFSIEMVREDNWDWIMYMSKYLLQLDDENVVSKLEQYVKGDISEEIVKRNENSIYTRMGIQNNSSMILDEYNGKY